MSYPSMPDEQVRDLTWGWWLIALVGVLAIVAGVIVLFKPSDSLATLAVIIGIFILIDSIFELVVALFGAHSAAAALLGVVGIVIGILLIRHPTHSVLFIALLIGIWLVAIGVIRLVGAFALENRVWNIVVALIEIVAGIVIVSDPHIGYTALAIIVGIAFILKGLSLCVLGWAMHAVRNEAT